MTDRDRYQNEASSAWWEREDQRPRESDRPDERGSFARNPDWRDRDRYERTRAQERGDWQSGWRAADDPYVDYGEARERTRRARGGEFGPDYGPASAYRPDRAQDDFGDRGPRREASYRPSPGGSAGGYGSAYDGADYGLDPRAERSFRPESGGYDNPRRGTGRYAYGWREDRGWWDHTKDRIAGAFGDSDAQRRADWDSYQRDAGGEHRGKGPKGYSRSDDRVREDVSDRLSDDSWLDASSIEVQAKSGEVTLSGTVMSRGDKRRAEDLADRVSGVSHVQNNLRVHPGGDVYGVDTRPTATGSTTGKVS